MATAVKSVVCQRTLVIEAASNQDFPQVLSLLRQKASPFQGDAASGRKDQEILFLFLTCLGINVKSLPALSNWFFPKFVPLAQTHIHEARCKIPHSKAVKEFDSKKKTLAIKPFNDLQLMEAVLRKLDMDIPSFSSEQERAEYLEEQCFHAPLEVVQQTLSQMHPLFDLAWTLTSNPKPIKLVNRPQRFTHMYSFHSHTIIFGNTSGFQDLIRRLVFHTLLALHRETLQALYERPVDRESDILIRAYMRFRIEQITEEFLKSIFPKVYEVIQHFDEFWMDPHYSFHVIDPERIKWNKKLFLRHLHQHPEFFAEKLEELRNIPAKA